MQEELTFIRNAYEFLNAEDRVMFMPSECEVLTKNKDKVLSDERTLYVLYLRRLGYTTSAIAESLNVTSQLISSILGDFYLPNPDNCKFDLLYSSLALGLLKVEDLDEEEDIPSELHQIPKLFTRRIKSMTTLGKDHKKRMTDSFDIRKFIEEGHKRGYTNNEMVGWLAHTQLYDKLLTGELRRTDLAIRPQYIELYQKLKELS